MGPTKGIALDSTRYLFNAFSTFFWVVIGVYHKNEGFAYSCSIRHLMHGVSEADQSPAVSTSRQSKSAIGQKTLQLCLTHFTDTSGAEIPRRWSGRLLLELVRGSADNKHLLASAPEGTRRGLGKLVLHSSDYSLRFIAADIIREMVCAQLDPNIFWPLGFNPKLATAFPTGQLADSGWIENYSSFILAADKEISGDVIENGHKMHTALSVTPGGSSHLSSRSSLALVMPNRVTIAHAATRDHASQFVDIMLDNIEECRHRGEDHCAINIEFVKNGIGSYVKDGLAMKADKFSLVFRNKEEANKFLAAIEWAAPHITGAQPSQDLEAKGRNLSAAYVGLAGPSSPPSISPNVLPIFHNSTLRGKENTKASRAASFAFLSLPSQEEVVARSSAILGAQLSPINDTVPVLGSGNSLAICDCPELIKSSIISGIQHDPRELEKDENGDDGVSPTSDEPFLSETEHHPTAGHSRETQLEDTKVDHEDQVASSRVVNSEGSMRLQQGEEGSDPHAGLPSPIHQTLRPSSQGNVALQVPASPGCDKSPRGISPQVGNGDMNCPRKLGADSVEVPDSQQDGTNSNNARRENGMPFDDSISPKEIQETANAGDASVTPAETVSISRLKRPQHKIIGAGVKGEVMDWDQDLRVSDHEENPPNTKKPKTSPKKVPMRSKAKNSLATKTNRQGKATMPKTPKAKTPSTIRKAKMASKRAPTKTLASSRQRRAAAAKPNENIAKNTCDGPDNFDVGDPIETTSPEQSSLETPMTKPATSKNCPSDGNIMASERLSLEDVCNDDGHGPIILDSPIGGDVITVHQPLDKSPTPPPAKEALVLDTFVNSLDTTLLHRIDSQPCLQVVDTLPRVDDMPVPAKDIFPQHGTSSGPPGDIIPACIPEREAEEIEAIGTGKRTFAEKLSLALLGTGIHLADNVTDGDEIMHTEESPPMSKFDFSNVTTLPRRGNVSQVAQKVAEFMSRKPKTGKLPPTSDGNELMAKPATQNLDHRVLKGNGNSIKDVPIPKYQALTKSHQSAETISTGRGSNSSCALPCPAVANLSTVTTDYYRSNQAPKSPLVDERTHRKAQIVSFDIDGPRNQCLSSTKKTSVHHTKPITPILKEPSRKSTTLKRKAGTQREERNFPNQKDEDALQTPNAKRLMTEPAIEEPDTFAREDGGSMDDLLGPELLSQSRPSRLFGSQQSMVDLNGSPRRGTRVPRNPQIARVQAKEVKKGDRKKECVTEPNLIRSRNYNPRGKGDVQVQPSEEEPGSNEEDIEPVDSNSAPGRHESAKEREEERKSLDSDGTRFLFRRPAKTPHEEPHAKHAIISHPSDINLSRFIDSLTSRPRTTGVSMRPDVDSEAETELAGDDTDGVSSYSTDSIPSLSSETLVHHDLDADVEWRDTLRATQKTTLDILFDTSKRLVRHLVDEETAITDLVTIYQSGCAKLLEQLRTAHDENTEEGERQMQPLKKHLLAIYEGANGRLKAGRENMQKLPSANELFSGVRKRKGLASRIDDVIHGYGVETDC